MCGRFDLNEYQLDLMMGVDVTSSVEAVGERPPFPRYNIAPTNLVLTIISDGEQRYPRIMRWGLIPRWSKEINSKYTMINARDDKLLQTRSYTGPFKNQRCLIPASGFYEWKKGPDKTRLPLRFSLKSGEPFAFAGIWEKAWPNNEETLSCSIITTSPNELVTPIHDRMPVILPPDLYQIWMDPHNESSEDLLAMLQPYDAALMKAYPVSQDVNNVRNQGAELIEPVGDEVVL